MGAITADCVRQACSIYERQHGVPPRFLHIPVAELEAIRYALRDVMNDACVVHLPPYRLISRLDETGRLPGFVFVTHQTIPRTLRVGRTVWLPFSRRPFTCHYRGGSP